MEIDVSKFDSGTTSLIRLVCQKGLLTPVVAFEVWFDFASKAEDAVRRGGRLRHVRGEAEELPGSLRPLHDGDVYDEELDRVVFVGCQQLSSIPVMRDSCQTRKKVHRFSYQNVKAMAQSSRHSERAKTSEAYKAFLVDFRIWSRSKFEYLSMMKSSMVREVTVRKAPMASVAN